MKNPTVGHALAMGLAASFAAATPFSAPLPPLPADNATCTTTSWVDLAPSAGVNKATAVTVTKYSTVVYQHTAVNCGSCGHLQVATRVQDALPLETVTFSGAATITRGYCAGHGFFPQEDGARVRRHFEMVDPLEYDANDGDKGVLILGNEEDGDCTASVMEGPQFLDMDATSVAYKTTITLTRVIDCGSCTNASPVPIRVSVPHLGPYNATMTVDNIPFKTTELVCGKTLPTDGVEAQKKKKTKSKPNKASKTKPPKKTKPTPTVTETWPPPLEVHTVYGRGRTTAECFYNYALYPDRLDHTRKIWTSTFTSVAHKKCDHCGLIWFTAPYDPPVPESVFTTTVFKKGRKTATAMACSD